MAKKAAKKAAKKVARKKAVKLDEKSSSSLDRGHSLNDPAAENIGELARKIIGAVGGRYKNRPINMVSAADIQKKMLPVGHFYFQYLIGSYGLQEASTVMLIGDKNTGKTTLGLMMMGASMAGKGAWPLYIGCENKNPNAARIKRCLHPHAPTAERLARNLQVIDAFSLTQMWFIMRKWVATMRGKEKAVVKDGEKAQAVNVPMHIPLIIYADPITRLLDPEEEIGQFDFGDNMSETNKAKVKEVGTHKGRATAAKWMQEFARHVPHWCLSNNVLLILSAHQNDEMQVKTGPGGTSLPKVFTEMFNTNHRGGRGAGQVSSLQLILVPAGRQSKGNNGDDVTGNFIRIRTEKQSYGPSNRVIEFELRSEFTRDSEFFTEPPVIFDDAFAQWLVKKKLFGLTLDKKLYSSNELGVYGGTAADVSSAVHTNPELLNRLGVMMHVEGYYDMTNASEMQVEPLGDNEEEQEQEEGDAPEVSEGELEMEGVTTDGS